MGETIKLTGYGLPPNPYIPQVGDIWENEYGDQVRVVAVEGVDVTVAEHGEEKRTEG